MKFSASGKWTFNGNVSLSDKIRSKLSNLIAAIKGADVKDGEKPVQIFGEVLSNSEIHWETSCELNVEDFIAIQKEARENDNHILEWCKKFGKALIDGVLEIVTEAKVIVPEVQQIDQDYEIQKIKNSEERSKLREEVKRAEKERAEKGEADQK
jgi:hypothetical protein